jgi:RNA polymerase sigma factor (sigma-70 family)
MTDNDAAPPPDEDAALIREAQRNPQAFQPLYERWVVPVYRYLISRTGNEPDAEELTARVFLAALQALPRYRHNGRFAGWLFTIARNQARDFFRKQSREVTLEQIEETAADDPSLVEQVEIHNLLSKLTAGEQDLLRLRYSARLSFAEIGAVQGKSEDAVKKTLYRLQSRLQRGLEEEHEQQNG